MVSRSPARIGLFSLRLVLAGRSEAATIVWDHGALRQGIPNCANRRCQPTVPGGSIDRHDVDIRDTDNRSSQPKLAVTPDARGDRGSTLAVRPAHLARRVTRDFCGIAGEQGRREMDPLALDRWRWFTCSSVHRWHGR